MTVKELRKRQEELIQRVDALAERKIEEEILNANRDNTRISSLGTHMFGNKYKKVEKI